MCAIRRQNKRNSGLSRTGRPAAGAKVGVASGERCLWAPRPERPRRRREILRFRVYFVDFESLRGPGCPPQALKSAWRAKPPGPAA